VIRLVGTSGTATTADARVFHYRFYCELDTSEPRAVSIDMTPGADGRTGVLYIAGTGRVNTESALWIAFEVIPTKPITVSELLQFYKTKGFDRFRFNEEGAGCRSYSKNVLAGLESDCYVPTGTEARLVQWSDEKRKLFPENIPERWDEGEYY